MMFELLETERLTIRRFWPDDWADVFAYTSDPGVMKYMPENPFSHEDAVKLVNRNTGEDAKSFPVLIKGGNRVIGDIVFHVWYEPFQTWEIGWVFHPDYQGRGYATEAARAVLEYGFKSMSLHRIIATCDPENIASQRVMEKLGMRREGHFVRCIRKNGEWLDELFYALLDEEWRGVSR